MRKPLTGTACRAKGTRGENEFVEIMDDLGVYSQRVLGSGAMVGAKSDVKVGITLNEDGSKPDKDESKGVLRVEVKNRATNPEHLHTTLSTGEVAMVLSPRKGAESLWEYLNQDIVSKAVALRRSNIPHGAKAKKDYDQMWMICMGVEYFAELLKKAYAYDESRKVTNE